MRYALSVLAVLICHAGEASADPITIEQNAKTNYAVINSTASDTSDLTLYQSGRTNGASSTQYADQNSTLTTQHGWQNTVTIYQNGWTDISRVVQSGPIGDAGQAHLPTTFTTENTDDGYLTYFTSGGFSMVTLGDPGNAITSRFGRYR